MKRLSQVGFAILLSAALGLHWVALQSVAWVTMVVERTVHDSFETAVRTTFDGAHPCALCKVIAAGQSAAQESGTKSAGADQHLKGDLVLSQDSEPGRWPAGDSVVICRSCRIPGQRLESPPLPPPRSA